MMHVVTGGSGSGKSEYAERLITENASGPLIYVATMMVWDQEGEARVRRHRSMRADRGFITVEQYTDLKYLDLSKVCAEAVSSGCPGSFSEEKTVCRGDASVLLECMSNLVSNEFYRDEKYALSRILDGIESLRSGCRELVIVTNEVFSDGTDYSDETMRYIALLGEVNRLLGGMADTVTEVVYGIPVVIKGQKYREKENMRV